MKKIAIGIVTLVLIVGVVVGVFLVNSKDSGGNFIENEKKSLGESLFSVSNYNDLERITEAHKADISKVDESYFVFDVKTLGEKMTFAFVFDKDNNLLNSTTYCTFEADFSKVEKFSDKVTDILDSFAGLFGVEAQNFYIYSDTDVYSSEDINSLQKVLNGEATIEFRIRDRQSEYWCIKIEKTNESEIFCLIEHYVDSVDYDTIPVNVDLSLV